jgi:tetratricopeptide (TPR) repeat protein
MARRPEKSDRTGAMEAMVRMSNPRHGPHQIALKAYNKGDLLTAERLYGKILRQFPNDFNALHMLGLIRAQQRKFLEADRLIARALLYGKSAEALSNHGNVLSELGFHDAAIKQLRHALLVRPDSAENQFNLGNALVKALRPEEAAKAFRAAIAIRPDFADALHNYADLLRETGRYVEAVALLQRAIAVGRGDPELHIALGVALQESGELEGADRAFEAALALDPSATSAYYHRGRMGKVGADDDALPRMEAQARRADTLSPDARAMLGFALAKAYEDTGRYDEAFDKLLEANRLVRNALEFDEARARQRFERLHKEFTAKLLADKAGFGCESRVPIFVVGFPRSGTTLTEQILASHPQIHGSGENSFIENLASAAILKVQKEAATDEKLGFPESLSYLPAEPFRRAGELYVERLRQIAPDAPHITDKLPANFMFVGFIHLILPNARIIHVKRDAMDTCISCFAQRFRLDNVGFSYDLGELGRHYRQYLDLMEHWRRIMPAGSMLEVQYENLVDNLEGEARRLLDYCGLAWDERCLAFHRTERAVRTASLAQVRQPIYRSSVQRWRRYEKHLGPLIAGMGELAPANGTGPAVDGAAGRV